MANNDLRYISSREIISAEARILVALGFFHGNNEQSFLTCYIKSHIMNNLKDYITDVDTLSHSEKQKYAEDYINSMPESEMKQFRVWLISDLKLIESGILEELFNLTETKLEFMPPEIKDKKLSELLWTEKNGEQISFAQFILEQFGITEENNEMAYDYFMNHATVFGFCKDMRNAIAHNDEDNDFINKNSSHEPEHMDLRYILRSDFFVEMMCKYAKTQEDAKNKNFGYYEMLIPNSLLHTIIGFIELKCFDENSSAIIESFDDKILKIEEEIKIAEEKGDKKTVNNLKKELQKAIETKNVVEKADINYHMNYHRKMKMYEKTDEKFDGKLGINAKQCGEFAKQKEYNHDYLIEEKFLMLQLCSYCAKYMDCGFGELWGHFVNDQENKNRAILNMETGLSTTIVSNMLYQIFTADHNDDIVKDVLDNIFNDDPIVLEDLPKKFLTDKGKVDEERVKTIVARFRNSTQHGLYMYDYDGGITLLGTKDSRFVPGQVIEPIAHLTTNEMLELSTMKKIQNEFREARIRMSRDEKDEAAISDKSKSEKREM